MSTVAPARTDGQVQPDEYIAAQLATARRRIKSTDVLTAAVLCGILLIGYVLVFTVLDHWLIPGGFSAWTRAIMLGLVLAGVAGIAWHFIVRRLSRSITPLYAARMLDRETDSGGALSSLIDLQSAGAAVAESIQQTIEKRAAVRLAKTGVDEAIDRTTLVRLGVTLFALVAATCLYAVLSPKGISLLRPLSLSAASVATRTTILDVDPGDVTIPAGGQLEITADIGGVIPETVTLRYTTEDRRFVNEELDMAATNDEGRYSALITGDGVRGIRQKTAYVIVAGDSQSQEFTIDVDAAPTASVRSVTSHYPDYMGLPDRQTFDGRIDTWEGSDVEILAETNVRVKQADLELCSDRGFGSHVESHPMNVADRDLAVDFKLVLTKAQPEPRFYRILVEDERGRTDSSPTIYPVRIRRDAAPNVKLLDPVRDLHVPANAVVPLLIEAEDPDFQLRSVTLRYDINGEPVEPGERVFDAVQSGSKKKWTGSYDFHLKPLDLRAGDVVRYFVAARDNKEPRGSQGRSAVLKFTIQNPVSQEKVDEQLARDRELQKEQREENQPDDTEAAGDDGDKDEEEAEKNSKGDESGDATDSASDAADDQGNSDDVDKKNGDENDPDGISDPDSDVTGRNGDDSEKQTGSEETDGTGRDIPGGDPSENDRDQSGGPSRDTEVPNGDGEDSSTDEEALKKILDAYREPQDTDSPRDEKPQGADEQDRDQQNRGQQNNDQQDKDPQAGDPQNGDPQNDGQQDNDKQDERVENGDPQDGDKQDGDKQDGDKQGGDKQGGDKQDGDKQDGDKQDGDKQDGDKQDGDKQDGDKQDGDKQDGDKQDGDKQGGDKQGGDEQGGDKQDGDEQDGDKQGGDKQGGDEQGGDKQGGDKQGGDEQGGDKQGGDKQGGDKQGGDKQGGDKQGGDKQGGDKQGGDKQGGDKQGGDKQGGDKQGGDKQGGDKQGGDKQGGDKQGGDKQGGDKPEGGKQEGGDAPGGAEPGGPGKPGGPDAGKVSKGTQGAGSGETQVDDARLDDAKEASNLALERLQRDLDRGEVDEKLLKELGWTEDELKKFGERMRKQLDELDEAATNDAEALQQRRVEELLKSLNLNPKARSRTGSDQHDRVQQDTEIRRSKPPARYRRWVEEYQRSFSEDPKQRLGK